MKLLEYEAKNILATFSIPVPRHTLVTPHNNESFDLPVVLKSQVPVGGRGKLGGIVIANTKDEAARAINTLFSLEIKGYLPKVLLAEKKLAVKKEHYVALLIDKKSASIRLVAHKDGGIEVEDNNSADFLNIPIGNATLNNCADKLAEFLNHEVTLIKPILTNLYTTFVQNDATLLEINPLIHTVQGDLVCGDCKMELDDAAAFRHPEWSFQDTPSDTNFVTLDQSGTVATVANGAGLAMATVDAVAAKGLTPANFLDIGGGANMQSILDAFQKIVEFPNVQAIVINIFAGITRCDEVARAIIEAKKHIGTLPPLYIRLAGTNFEEAVALLAEENITTLATLEECLDAAKEATRG